MCPWSCWWAPTFLEGDGGGPCAALTVSVAHALRAPSPSTCARRGLSTRRPSTSARSSCWRRCCWGKRSPRTRSPACAPANLRILCGAAFPVAKLAMSHQCDVVRAMFVRPLCVVSSPFCHLAQTPAQCNPGLVAPPLHLPTDRSCLPADRGQRRLTALPDTPSPSAPQCAGLDKSDMPWAVGHAHRETGVVLAAMHLSGTTAACTPGDVLTAAAASPSATKLVSEVVVYVTGAEPANG